MLKIADVIGERSTCRRRSVGCVLVDNNNRVLSIGHNGAAKGVNHCLDVPCAGSQLAPGTGLEACEAIHAEQNALMFCPDIMKIDACFVTVSPCVHCVKMLMNTSCKTIVAAKRYAHNDVAAKLWTNSDRLKREWLIWGADINV